MQSLTGLIILVSWIGGIVLAKGFWSTFFACVFAPYSIYLVIEHILILTKII
jgi:hypothetical protein